ncbi:MAG: hypothetical protein ACI86H_001086 [bacterium]|jgi:hypothetical protein
MVETKSTHSPTRTQTRKPAQGNSRDTRQRQNINPTQSISSFFAKFFLHWFLPIVIFIGLTLCVYLFFVFFDLQWSTLSLEEGIKFFKISLSTNQKAVNDSIGSFIELNAAILGLVITVVAIVLQLAAQRYTTKLVDLFLSDKVNVGALLFMIFTLMYSVMVIFAIKENFFPIYAITVLFILVLIEIAILIPFFRYVFKFLTPENIISSIRNNSKQSITYAIKNQGLKDIGPSQKEVNNALEQISDTVLSSNTHMDRNVALMALNQIREMVLDYQVLKGHLGKPWYLIDFHTFIGISSDFFDEIKERKIWVEAKAFMNMELIFKMSIRTMPDAISAIAYNTRILGEEAIKNKDRELLTMVVAYYNTFLRIALNDKNVKAIFNLLYQYRMLTEKIFAYDMEMAEKVLFYFKYYGQESMRFGIWFVLYTAAMDIGQLLAFAYDQNVENLPKLLDVFLTVDDDLDPVKDKAVHKGVRKAQLIFAAYLMSKGDRVYVAKILEDLRKTDTFNQLISFRDELLAVKDKKFWEVTDRGINFEYIDTTQKSALCEFYDEFIISDPEQFKK